MEVREKTAQLFVHDPWVNVIGESARSEIETQREQGNSVANHVIRIVDVEVKCRPIEQEIGGVARNRQQKSREREEQDRNGISCAKHKGAWWVKLARSNQNDK